MRLAGKIALVTGGGRGIGRAVSIRLAQEGAKVAVLYQNGKDAADATADAIRQAGGEAMVMQRNVADADAADSAVDEVAKLWGRLDVLVNNAGVIRDGLAIRMSVEDWNEVLRVNLTGAFLFCKAAGAKMMSQRSGSVINLSSVAARHSNKGQANYAASKAGMEALTRTLATELAARKVRFNCVAPGFIETDMTTAVRDAAGEKILAAVPLKRFGAPEDVAAAVAFLASDDAAYITGQVITVDGGLSLGGVA